MAIRFLSSESVDGNITGKSIRTNTGNLFVGNGSNTTANIYGFGDTLMIQGVSGATYLRVSGTGNLAGTLQAGQYILATGLAYGAVNSYTQIINGSTGAITGTTADFTGNVVAGGNLTVTGNITGSSGTGHFSLVNASAYQLNGTYVMDSSRNLVNIGSGNFSGGITVTGGTTGADIYINNTSPTLGFTDSNSFSDPNDIYIIRGTSNDSLEFKWYDDSAGTTERTFIIDSIGNATFEGNGSFDTILNVTAPDNGGSPAMTSRINLHGYDGRGVGIKIKDNVTTSGGGTDREWFVGSGYNQSGFNIGYAADGSQSSYAAQTKLQITTGGNVGIGTASPDYTLDVAGEIGLDSYLRHNGDSNTFFGFSGNDEIKFRTAGSDRIFINSSGNVGIGTTSPGEKLDVQGNILVADYFKLGSSANYMGQLGFNRNIDTGGIYNSSYGAYQIQNAQGDLEFQVYNSSGGTVGIHKFFNNGNVFFDGNVGIGTTSPGAQLHNYSTAATNVFITGHGTAAQNDWGAQNCMFVKTDNGLLISKANAANNTNRIFNFYNDNNGYAQLYMHAGATAFVKIQASGDSYFNGGNVGIGSTNPTSISANTSSLTVGSSRNDLTGAIVYQANGTIKSQMYWDSAGLQTVVNSGDARWYTGGVNDRLRITSGGNVGIGESQPNYNLEIGGTANPVVAIVSNINSATSSLYFGDSDAKDRGQIKYTHFGDFMEIKTGGGLRLYLESGINTAYTSDGLFNANATPSYWNHGQAQFKLGYMDNGSGLYSGAYCFNVKSTDGIPVTGREIGAIYVRDTSNNRMPLIISNQGRINLNQTNTSTGYGSSTGWISVQNGTGAYNIFNYYTGTDGNSGCARYRVDNTSPSFFDFYYSTTQVGYITTNGTDIFYANTSDYRLKEDLKSFDGMSLLEQIQVYDFKWKESDNRMYGVVAHELQEVIPQAVVGEKDKEKLQAVDYSKLVPVLIKSIQELEARVKQLENN